MRGGMCANIVFYDCCVVQGTHASIYTSDMSYSDSRVGSSHTVKTVIYQISCSLIEVWTKTLPTLHGSAIGSDGSPQLSLEIVGSLTACARARLSLRQPCRRARNEANMAEKGH